MEFLAFITAGSFAFWSILFLWSIILIWSIEYNNVGYAVFSTIATLVVVTLFTTFNPFAWMWDNPWTLLFYVGVYFAGGMAWGLVKWLFHLYKLKEVAQELKKKYTTESLSHDATRGNMPIFDHWIVERRDWTERSYPPQASDNVAKLTFWATYWPWNAFWTLLNDPIRWAWRFIYRISGNALQRIANGVFRDV